MPAKKTATSKRPAKKSTTKRAKKQAQTAKKTATKKSKAVKKSSPRTKASQPKSKNGVSVTVVAFRDHLNLAVLSPYRFPWDTERLAMQSARVAGLAFVMVGVLFTTLHLPGASAHIASTVATESMVARVGDANDDSYGGPGNDAMTYNQSSYYSQSDYYFQSAYIVEEAKEDSVAGKDGSETDEATVVDAAGVVQTQVETTEDTNNATDKVVEDESDTSDLTEIDSQISIKHDDLTAKVDIAVEVADAISVTLKAVNTATGDIFTIGRSTLDTGSDWL